MKMNAARLLAGVVAYSCAAQLSAATITVTNTADDGPGSLRQAILDSNASVGVADTIEFAIPGTGVQTIAPITPLPDITDPVTIDGYTQPGSSPNTLAVGENAVLLVEIYALNTFALHVHTDSTVIRGLVIAGTLYLDSSSGQGTLGGHVIRGNFIGTDPSGMVSRQDLGSGILSTAPNVTIGGSSPADRNVISGNSTDGFFSANVNLQAPAPGGIAGTLIQGNYIGTNAAGTAKLGNSSENVVVAGDGVTVGGPNAGEGNLISGAEAYGLSVHEGNTVLGNLIGTDVTGTMPVPNVRSILVDGDDNVIGGITSGSGNVVAFSTLGGILVQGGTGNAIRGNGIFFNGGPGIDLGSDGFTPNDPGDSDPGANLGQNFPLVFNVTSGASTTTIHGRLDSTPDTTFDLDFYANSSCMPRRGSLLGGAEYVGSGQATTDATGTVVFSIDVPLVADPNAVISATATDPSGNTSELSQRLLMTVSPGSGPAAGGTSVTLTGMHFVSGAAISVAGIAATDVVVVNENQLTASFPSLPAGTIAAVTISNPDDTTDTRSPGFLVDFADVPDSHPFYAYVTALVLNGVTAGCGGGNYCVDAPVDRAQMSVFLLKGKHGMCYAPPAATGTVFADVQPGDFAADWIEALAAEGITSGCGGGNYCPDDPVRRDQMAVFLLKAEHGSGYVPPPCFFLGVFDDVPCTPGVGFPDWIEQLAAEQITGGCGGGNYCPLNPNTRGQMAVFVGKTFQLQ